LAGNDIRFGYFVIPAKAGIQKPLKRLDFRFRGNDVDMVPEFMINHGQCYPAANLWRPVLSS
jgi:hypothetical protein